MPRQKGETTVSDFSAEPSRSEEWRTFLLLTIVLAPVVTVGLIGSYGFLVWMAQLFLGPPSS